MGSGVTIYDIARAAGVGIATVSRVINGDAHVRPNTRANVQQAIAELGYRPSRAARRLAQGGESRPRVAALVPFFTAVFYFTVTRSLSIGLREDDIDLVLHDIKTRDDKNRVLDRLIAERTCEGLVFFSCSVSQERAEQLSRLGIPAVCGDFRSDTLPSVYVDNYQGGTDAVNYLRRCGSRKPALIGGPTTATALVEREQAFIETEGEDAPRIRCRAIEPEAAKVAVLELLEQQPGIDGLVCVNDMIAVGAMAALEQLGRRVPDDIQVIGFDDQPLMEYIGLTTIRQPIAKFGRWTASSIAKRIAKPTTEVRSKELPLELIARRTTREPQN